MAAIGIGLAALGRPAYLNLGHDEDFHAGRSVDDMRRRTHDVLDAAWDADVRCFDAARSYGLAEEFLGDWLRLHPSRRTALTIGSKWGYTYVGDWRTDVDVHEVKDHALATFERQWPETLAALGGSPDVYLIHSVTPDSPALEDGPLLAALADLADAGVRVGISTSGPAQRRVVEAALALDGPFTAVQSTWNLLEPSAGPALTAAHDAGWLVTLKETLANGRLTARADLPVPIREYAHQAGVTPDAVALAAAMALPVDVVLAGPSTVAQLESNLVARDLDVDADTLGVAPIEPDTYWSERSSLPWI